MSGTANPHCGREWPAGTKRCGICGALLAPGASASATPEPLTRNRWARSPGELARKFQIAELKTLLSTKLEVEAGTYGLLLEHGQITRVLTEGTHFLTSIADWFHGIFNQTDRAMVLADTRRQQIRLEIPRLLTRDPHEAEAEVTLSYAVAEPTRISAPSVFFAPLLQGAVVITAGDITSSVLPVVTRVLSKVIGDATAVELQAESELRERVEDELDEHLRAKMKSLGLEFHGIWLDRLTCAALDNLQRSEARIKLNEEKLKLRERYTRLVEQFEAEATDEKIAKLKSQQDEEDFIAKLRAKSKEDEKQREFHSQVMQVSRDQSLEIARNKLETTKDDLEAKRQFLKRQLELQLQSELDELEHGLMQKAALRDGELQEAQLDRKIRLREKQIRADQDIELGTANHQAVLASLRTKQGQEQAAATTALQQERLGLVPQLIQLLKELEQPGQPAVQSVDSLQRKRPPVNATATADPPSGRSEATRSIASMTNELRAVSFEDEHQRACCPQCHKPVHASDKYCIYCTASLSPRV